jgi:Na+/proline symporter
MPDKYEREIEEIFRNLERTQPKAGFGQKFSGRLHRKASARRSMPPFRLNFSQWCLAIACVAALGAGGWAYAHGSGDLLTGIIGLIGAVCIVFVALSPFVVRQRSSSSTRR